MALGIISSFEANLVQVANWYRTDLGRTASMAALMADPGVVQWATRIGNGTRPDVVRATILSSAEFSARHGGTIEGVIVGAYHALLARNPNLATINEAAKEIRSGSWDVPTFLKSVQSIEEAARTKVAAWYRSDLGRSASIADLKSDYGVVNWARLLGRG